jgi:peptidoglycan hydrolase-like protein with peptidoglycan-binding domain
MPKGYFMRLDWGKPMQSLFALASAVAILAIGNTSAWAIGPSFDCATAQRPGAQIICSRPDLSQTELALTQAYYALRWQAGPAGAAPLNQEDLNFENQTVQQCRVPRNGQLPPDAAGIAACMQRAYEHQRANWMSRLTGPAAEEAARRLEDHVALQRQLQLSGFLPSTETIDGVYGATTRTAISAWQRANNRPDTSFLSNADAAILLAGQQPAASPARQASPNTLPSVVPPATRGGPSSLPSLNIGGNTGGSPSDLSLLEDMLAQYWDTTGSGGLVMVLGFFLVAAGVCYLIRPPSSAGNRAANPSRFAAQTIGSSRTARAQGSRGPQLVLCGVLIVLSGACVAYGPTTVYEAVYQRLTSMFA